MDEYKNTLTIGIPKENQKIEKRLAITPETAALLVEAGYRVLVESDAGITINYSDRYYAESGAEIVFSAAEVYQADIILKISPPTFEEILLMRPRTTVFSFLQIHSIFISCNTSPSAMILVASAITSRILRLPEDTIS